MPANWSSKALQSGSMSVLERLPSDFAKEHLDGFFWCALVFAWDRSKARQSVKVKSTFCYKDLRHRRKLPRIFLRQLIECRERKLDTRQKVANACGRGIDMSNKCNSLWVSALWVGCFDVWKDKLLQFHSCCTSKWRKVGWKISRPLPAYSFPDCLEAPTSGCLPEQPRFHQTEVSLIATPGRTTSNFGWMLTCERSSQPDCPWLWKNINAHCDTNNYVSFRFNFQGNILASQQAALRVYFCNHASVQRTVLQRSDLLSYCQVISGAIQAAGASILCDCRVSCRHAPTSQLHVIPQTNWHFVQGIFRGCHRNWPKPCPQLSAQTTQNRNWTVIN